MEIPKSISEISLPWLSEALDQSAVEHPGISSVSTAAMPGITGALGEVGLVDIAWAGPTDLPTTMVAKCPLDDDTARLYNSVMQNYIREAGFYRDLADKVPMRVPRCFVNAESPNKDSHMLLIEKIEGVDGDILAGAGFEIVTELVEKMAAMHGLFWQSEQLSQLDWMLDWNAPSLKLGIPMIQQGWQDFNAANPNAYSPALVEFCEASFIHDTEYWLEIFSARPWTFVHLDYELDNMIYTAGETAILDWQTCLKSFPGADLAWLLATSESDESVARESELIDLYRATLAATGGPAMSHDDVVEELAWGVIYPTSCQPIPNMADLSVHGQQEDRMKDRFRAFLDRSIRAAERWDLVGHCSPHLR